MSGGRFDYKDEALKTEIFGWGDKPTNVFEDREISELTWDLLNLIREYDWYISGDTGRDDYLVAKDKFKTKWLGNRGTRVKSVIDDAIRDLRTELYETFGFKDGPPHTYQEVLAMLMKKGQRTPDDG